MIKRLYVDNFRCLVNFEYQPAQSHLLFGENGSGKTTVFDVLERLQELIVVGQPVSSVFQPYERTLWNSRRQLAFEIEIEGPDGNYHYTLQVQHHNNEQKSLIAREELKFNSGILYLFDGDDVQLFADDLSKGPKFPMDSSRSALATLPERDDNKRLSWFKSRMNRIFIFNVDPSRIVFRSTSEDVRPARDMSNFASWYRRIVQEVPQVMQPLFDSLARVIPGFQRLQFQPGGFQEKFLMACFQPPEQGAAEYRLALDNLSSGQKCLLVYFSLLQFAREADLTFCFDEPDNFIAIRELRPWLSELLDQVEKHPRSQCLFVSHHPEFLDDMARDRGAYFERIKGGPSRVRRLDPQEYENLAPSELAARGWLGS